MEILVCFVKSTEIPCLLSWFLLMHLIVTGVVTSQLLMLWIWSLSVLSPSASVKLLEDGNRVGVLE